MAGRLMMGSLMSDTTSTSASKNTAKKEIPSRTAQSTSTASRASGRTPNDASLALTASKLISNATSKNVSGDGARTLIRSLPNCANYWSKAFEKKNQKTSVNWAGVCGDAV